MALSLDNTTQMDLDCPEYGPYSDYYIQQVRFWVEGVIQTIVAIPGLIGNIVFSLLLTRKDLRNSFNLLLVALAFFDSCYIIGAVLETLRTSFDLASDIHLMLFPYLLYPGQNIAMTVSIFLIVAIAFERFLAVRNPIDYNQAMNDAAAIRLRLLKFLLPVIIFSVLFNLPMFFESTYVTVTRNVNGLELTSVELNVTDLRIDPNYSTYVNWSQSIVLGFVPAVLLMYFNTKIYLDIRERERRKRPRKQILVDTPTNSGYQQRGAIKLDPSVPIATAKYRETFKNVESSGSLSNYLDIPLDGVKNEASTSSQEDGKGITTAAQSASKGATQTAENGQNVKEMKSPSKFRFRLSIDAISGGGPPQKQIQENKASNAKRRRSEDKMAMIFVAIVTGFLLSNSPRILLNFHEVVVLDNAMACSRAGFRSFPVWCRILTSFSHLFLVLNSSINILFYCMFNSQFRVEARKALNEMFEKCSRRDESGGLHCQNASRDRISPQRNKLKNTNTNPNSSSEMDEALLSNSGVNATKV